MKNIILSVKELAFNLCKINSITGNESEVLSYIEKLCNDAEFFTQRQLVDQKASRSNLFIKSSEKSSPKILLTTHIDTVPPFFLPKFSADGKYLIARGACDAKGIAASMLCSFFFLDDDIRRDVAILFLVGEESLSDGAKIAAKILNKKFKYVINGEPTGLRLVRATKGTIVFSLETTGELKHSSCQDASDSAVHKLIYDLNALLLKKWPGSKMLGATTLNIGKINGGIAGNSVANKASANCVLRVASDLDLLVTKIKKTISPETSLSIDSKSQPFYFKEFAGFDGCVVAFGSDVPFLLPIGEPLLIGPGSISEAHTENEKIEISELQSAIDIYAKLCKKLLC